MIENFPRLTPLKKRSEKESSIEGGYISYDFTMMLVSILTLQPLHKRDHA